MIFSVNFMNLNKLGVKIKDCIQQFKNNISKYLYFLVLLEFSLEWVFKKKNMLYRYKILKNIRLKLFIIVDFYKVIFEWQLFV